MRNVRTIAAFTLFPVVVAATNMASAMPDVPAVVLPTIPTNPTDLSPRHKGGDTVSLYLSQNGGGAYSLWARLAWVTPTGIVASEDFNNCGTLSWTFSDDIVMDKQMNEICECNGRVNPGPVAGAWCQNAGMIKRPGPLVLGIIGSELVFRKCGGLTYRWSFASGDIAVPDAGTDWVEFRTDEGTHVLEYGTYGQPYGLRVVSSVGSGIALGQVLYPPNGTWTVSDYSLKSDSITVRVANASTGERRCDYYARSGSTFTLVRSMTGSQLGGEIIGIGDRRVAVWSSARPGKVAVLRMDSAPPFVETVFDLPSTPDGTSYSSVSFAYARRGSLVCSARWASDTKAAIVVGSRVEQIAPCPGDLNADRRLDGADIGILLDQWGPASLVSVADINRDGIVNGADLGLLLTYWGPCPN